MPSPKRNGTEPCPTWHCFAACTASPAIRELPGPYPECHALHGYVARRTEMVPRVGCAPTSPVFQTGAFTRLAFSAWCGRRGSNPHLHVGNVTRSPLRHVRVIGERPRNRTLLDRATGFTDPTSHQTCRRPNLVAGQRIEPCSQVYETRMVTRPLTRLELCDGFSSPTHVADTSTVDGNLAERQGVEPSTLAGRLGFQDRLATTDRDAPFCFLRAGRYPGLVV